MTEHRAVQGRTAPVFTPVKLGDTFTRNVGPDNAPVDFTVVESCGENVGQWYCVTCSKPFRNNWEKDTHARSGVHVLTWACFEHGPEVP